MPEGDAEMVLRQLKNRHETLSVKWDSAVSAYLASIPYLLCTEAAEIAVQWIDERFPNATYREKMLEASQKFNQ
jgi:hypothetical protein